jgi:hypothetical protein
MRSWFAAAKRYCSATVRFPEDSRFCAGRALEVESSAVANVSNQTHDFGNEIRDLARDAKETGMNVILGLGCRGR